MRALYGRAAVVGRVQHAEAGQIRRIVRAGHRRQAVRVRQRRIRRVAEQRIVLGGHGGRDVRERGERRTGSGADRIDRVHRGRANVARRRVRIRPVVLVDAVVPRPVETVRVGICIRICHFHWWKICVGLVLSSRRKFRPSVPMPV